MSYRELRNFTEIMRTLGYPRIISMENFRKPNFELVADILYWMTKMYDPETTISDRVEFENERVEFLTSIASLLAAKARLHLNTKKLYASDGRAVQELLKLAQVLYKATQSSSKAVPEGTIPPPIKVQDVKAARGLASDITQSGAKLYDLLANELKERQERLQTLRFLDQAGTSFEGSREYTHIERNLKDIIEQIKQNTEDMRKECEELEADEKNMDSKIKKKQDELERTEKRLRSLENVRPQFVEEAEKLEGELQRYYEVYTTKYRNLDYLEHELGSYHKAEEERRLEQERKLKKMRERLLKEEVAQLRGGVDSGIVGNGIVNDAGAGGGLFNRGATQSKPQTQLQPGSAYGGGGYNNQNVRYNAGQGGQGGRAQVHGAINKQDSDVEDDEGDEDDVDDDEGEDSDGEVSMGSRGRRGGNPPRGGSGNDRGGGMPRGRGASGGSDDFVEDDDDEGDEEEGDEDEDEDEDEGSDEHF